MRRACAVQYRTVWWRMDKASQRHGREDWILAGFRALVAGGPEAVRVEPVARGLGLTKGSFYWHFDGLAAWHAAMLDYWEARAFSDIVAALAAVEPGLPRLRRLITVIGEMRSADHGGAAAEPALRDWARWQPLVRVAVDRVDGARLRYVAQCLADGGHPDPTLARLFYASHLGLEVLSLSDGEAGTAALLQLVDLFDRG